MLVIFRDQLSKSKRNELHRERRYQNLIAAITPKLPPSLRSPRVPTNPASTLGEATQPQTKLGAHAPNEPTEPDEAVDEDPDMELIEELTPLHAERADSNALLTQRIQTERRLPEKPLRRLACSIIHNLQNHTTFRASITEPLKSHDS